MKEYEIITFDLTFIDQIMDSIHERFPHHDVFETDKPFDLKEHYHSDFESRLFLEGRATFTIAGMEIHCEPGTYIEIYPNIKHSFHYNGNKSLKVMRFFSENEGWDATFT